MEYALVLLWLVALQALAVLGLPLAAKLFPRFPDRGATFALPVALVVATTVAYWMGHVAFGRWTAFLSVAALAGLSAVVLARDGSLADRLPWRGFLEAAAVFTVAFLFLVAVRAVDPAIQPGGGEKFLDFGIFTSLMRADALPPEDMWWAGDHVMYYYGGYLASGLLSFLTGTAPRYAFNLALAGFYATLVTAAYGLAGALADARGAPRRAAGLLGGFLVGFASNLVVPATALIWLFPGPLARGIADRIAGPLADPYSGELLATGLEEFGYWAPSRVIPETINEFPLFAFLNGDLHGHMVSQPFMLLVAAVGFAYYRTPAADLARRRALAFGVAPVVVGLLTYVNVWSLPTGVGVMWLSVVFGPGDPLALLPGVGSGERATAVPDGRGATANRSSVAAFGTEGRRVGAALLVAGVVAVLAVVWASPFVTAILLAASTGRGIRFLPTRSAAAGLALVHGTFLLAFGLYLWPRAREAFRVDPVRAGALGVGLVGVAWWIDYAVLALVVPLLALGWVLLRADADVGYETVLVVAGAGLVTLVEFAYVKDNAFPGRYNTVFKVYSQVWILWATAAGATLAGLVDRHSGPAEWSVPSTNVRRSDLMVVVTAVLVVSTSLYGGLALHHHFTADQRLHRADDPTLDGLAYVETYYPEEAEAIRWIGDRAGQPTIASAPGRSTYAWASPAASLTGVPTIIGWVWPEGIYRGHEVARRRAAEVDLLFRGTPDQTAELLGKHDVEYVYVGPRARDQYPNADLDFSELDGVEVAFENDRVVIYRVDRSEL